LLGIDLTYALIAFLVLIFSLTVHEAAHAWSADRIGDPTARHLGRVSLNPLVHIDPIGTLLFPAVAMTTGLPLIGWAKPVPVDPRNLRDHWRQKYMLISAAGPASNLVLALGAAIVFQLVAPTLVPGVGGLFNAVGPLASVLVQLVQLNVLLAVFNMVPVPPLDGGNVLAGVLTGPAAEAFDRLRPYGFLILYALMLSGVLWTLVGPIERALLGWLL
jgi:Zn-dependent protease